MHPSPADLPASSSIAQLGRLLHSRRFSPIGYFLGAGFIFLAPVGLAIYSNQSAPPNETLNFRITVFACLTLAGAAASAPLWIKGCRKRGAIVEAYEAGMRFIPRSGQAATFKYEQVTELRRKVFNGMLARLTLVLADGREYAIDNQGSKDAALINDVLARFGGVRWEEERGWRIG